MGLSDDLKKDLQKAVTSVGGYVAAREEQISELIERTAGKVDERTEKRYSGTIDKVKAGLHTGVARLAEQKDDEGGPATS
ncbi:hypothetical protein [Nocardioides marmoribigeumensis]|jgi:hypothetical protein|uniref:Antitoxin n=1 Tax=Nocardioides marmoribigeumensis TaxID=433649 RepID=A0ABU2BUE9_9ACTN|nr:hypothetical protein [Nocardioides marmoribigeumensis]MDR7362253.1 hypothetical protein [Nocardioides marmoribigeumensis]